VLDRRQQGKVLVAEATMFATHGDVQAATLLVSRALDHKMLLETDDIEKIASVLVLGSKVAEALDLYNDLLRNAPYSVNALRGKAMAHRFMGDAASAEPAFDRLLAIHPTDFEAQFVRSSLRRQTRENNHIDELERLLQGDLAHWRDVTALAFALSKEYHDIGRFDAAWFHLRNGAKIKRCNIDYRVAGEVSTMAEIARVYGREESGEQRAKPYDGPTPLFIVGLPRSGSTLVERILSSHPAVESLGESTLFPNILAEMLTQKEHLAGLSAAETSTQLNFDVLGQSYLERAFFQERQCSYLIDKFPQNFLNIGIIKRALPNARIIDVRRRPVDACFSMFRHLFTDGYPFSYDQVECAQYFAAYTNLMKHWDVVHPEAILKISYEALVAAPRQQAERATDYLELSWDDKCLAFADDPSPVLTASASQVRQPINSGHLDSWKPYASQLAPLAAELSRLGVAQALD